MFYFFWLCGVSVIDRFECVFSVCRFDVSDVKGTLIPVLHNAKFVEMNVQCQ